MALLVDSLTQQATPNLAHFLLGFELNMELRLTNLLQPGVLNIPSNCAKRAELEYGLAKVRRNRVEANLRQKSGIEVFSLFFFCMTYVFYNSIIKDDYDGGGGGE